MSENSSEAKANAAAKYSITDPRSPTNEYTRTPIHGMTNQAADLNHDDNMDDSNSSLETSSLISDSSGVCQQGKLFLLEAPKKPEPQISFLNSPRERPVTRVAVHVRKQVR